jgi:hypothetical protein
VEISVESPATNCLHDTNRCACLKSRDVASYVSFVKILHSCVDGLYCLRALPARERLYESTSLKY